MGLGFDTSTPLSSALASKFAAQGYGFVGRYLASPGAWKRLTPEEAVKLSDAGLYIVSLFERYAERAGEGANAGTEDGRVAFAQAQTVRQPERTVIYPAVDYNAGPDEYDAIEAYLRAFDAEIPGYELGVYGSYRVCEAMRLRGVTTKLMQTYAWSAGRVSDYVTIYQYENDVRENGIGIDRCRSNGDAGGWRIGMAIKEQAPLLSAEDANKVIGFLSAAYNAGLDPEEAHRLANELRKASGQPEQ